VALKWAPLTTTDFKPYLLRINASKPEVIGIIWAGDFSLIIRDMAALNMLGRIPIASIMIDLYTTNYINFCIPGMQGSLDRLAWLRWGDVTYIWSPQWLEGAIYAGPIILYII
jgi:hypothetical protein